MDKKHTKMQIKPADTSHFVSFLKIKQPFKKHIRGRMVSEEFTIVLIRSANLETIFHIMQQDAKILQNGCKQTQNIPFSNRY